MQFELQIQRQMKSPAPTPGRAKRTTFLSLGRGDSVPLPPPVWPGPTCERVPGGRDWVQEEKMSGWMGRGRKKEIQRGKRETETGGGGERVSNENERQRHKMGGDMDRQTTNKDQA